MDCLNEKEQKLVADNITYAKNLANEFCRKRQNLPIEREELEGAAYLGLCEAAVKYDESESNKCQFKTFAYFRIRGAMYDLLRKGHGTSRRFFNQLKESKNKTPEERAAMDFPYTIAYEHSELVSLVNSIDEIKFELFRSEERNEISIVYREDLNPEEAVIEKDTKTYLKKLVSELGEDERKILWEHYYNNRYFSEISSLLGSKSRSWVSRKHTDALRCLKESAEREQYFEERACLIQ